MFLGCGYKPSVYYQNKILGDNIKAVVEIDPAKPRETIFLKDALNDAIYTILNKNVCTQNCDTTIVINPNSSSIYPLDYDENGLPVLYRSSVVLKAEVIDKNSIKRNYVVSGTYDFKIGSSSILTDQITLEAYKRASINALDKLFAKITKDGANNDN